MRFLQALIHALLAALTAPLRMLGFGAPPSMAAAMAAAALADDEAPPEDAAPSRARSPFEGAQLGHLIKDHAGLRLGQRAPGMPELAEIPFWLKFWFDNLDDAQLAKIASVAIPGWLLQEHVLAGTGGTLPSLGYVTPAPATARGGSAAGGTDGKSASGGVKNKPADLMEILDDLGYAPARGMRMR